MGRMEGKQPGQSDAAAVHRYGGQCDSFRRWVRLTLGSHARALMLEGDVVEAGATRSGGVGLVVVLARVEQLPST